MATRKGRDGRQALQPPGHVAHRVVDRSNLPESAAAHPVTHPPTLEAAYPQHQGQAPTPRDQAHPPTANSDDKRHFQEDVSSRQPL